MSDQPRYTESEWRKREAKRVCLRDGHDYDVIAVRTVEDAGAPVSVRCLVCRKGWAIEPGPLPEASSAASREGS